MYGLEIENLLKFAQGDVEQVPDARRQALKNQTCEQGDASSM
jgi:hypothetical protein